MDRLVNWLFWAAALGLFAWATPSFAKPVLWTLKDVSFTDQGAAFGSFVFDDQISNGSPVLAVDITTTDGTTLTGSHYTLQNSMVQTDGFGLVLNSEPLKRYFNLSIEGFPGLTGVGATRPLSILSTEFSSAITGGQRSLAPGGTLFSSAVPEPSQFLMLAVGLLGIVAGYIRKGLLLPGSARVSVKAA